MCEPESVGTIVQRIMAEMLSTFGLELADQKEDWEALLEQLAQDKKTAAALRASAPRPRLRLLQGGKETPCGNSSAD